MKLYFLWLAKLLTVVILFFFIVPVLLVGVIAGSKTALDGDNKVASSEDAVAVIEVKGAIESSKEVLEELHKQAKNDKIKGIILRVDSPGGAVGPSQDIYDAVRNLKSKKPIVASMGSLAASGGLYVTLGASKIYTQPGTLTGSIGVILQLPNFSGITQRVGFDMVTIKSGELKDVGNQFRAMTDSERAFLQRTATLAHQDFIQAVVDGRKMSRENVEKFADGRIILGSEAKQLGLVDEFGDVYEAARAIFDILGQPLPAGEYPQLVYPADKFGQFKKFLETASSIISMLQPNMQLKFQMY